MKDLVILLNKISRLDLQSYPIETVKSYLQNIPGPAFINYNIHPGNYIFRARPNENGEQFTTRSQLSYKPENFNTTFQRASTPNNTMFYGSIVPEKLGPDDIEIGRATASFETAKTFRNNWFSSMEKITFGMWEVMQPINLVVIAYSPRFLREGSLLLELNHEFKKKIRNLGSERERQIMMVNEFIGQEFSKKIIRGDYDYIISAAYTELIINMGYDGVFYPSVKADGRGYNVCLTEECTDTSLKLVAAAECMIIKCGYNTKVINIAQSEISDDSIKFEYQDISNGQDPDKIWESMLTIQ